MTRRMITVAALVAALVLGTAASCDNPEGQRCAQEGSGKYTSKYGNFTCSGGRWVKN